MNDEADRAQSANAAILTPEQLGELSTIVASKPTLHAIVEAARQLPEAVARAEKAERELAYACAAVEEQSKQIIALVDVHVRAEKAERERDDALAGLVRACVSTVLTVNKLQADLAAVRKARTP